MVGISPLPLTASCEPKEIEGSSEITQLILSHCGLSYLPQQIGFVFN